MQGARCRNSQFGEQCAPGIREGRAGSAHSDSRGEVWRAFKNRRNQLASGHKPGSALGWTQRDRHPAGRMRGREDGLSTQPAPVPSLSTTATRRGNTHRLGPISTMYDLTPSKLQGWCSPPRLMARREGDRQEAEACGRGLQQSAGPRLFPRLLGDLQRPSALWRAPPPGRVQRPSDSGSCPFSGSASGWSVPGDGVLASGFGVRSIDLDTLLRQGEAPA